MKEYCVVLRSKMTGRLKAETIKASTIGDAKKAALIKNNKHECMHIKEKINVTVSNKK